MTKEKPSKDPVGNGWTASASKSFLMDAMPVNVITRPEDVKSFHADSPSHRKSPSSNGGWFFHQVLGDCMGLINDQRWKDVRAQLHAYFTHAAVVKSRDFLSGFTIDYFHRFEAKETNPFKLQAVTSFSRFPFLATAEYLYGPLTEAEKDQLWTLGQRSLGLMVHILEGGVYRFGICRWLQPKQYRQLKEFEKDWTEFNETIVEARKSRDESPPVVEAWGAVDEGVVTKKEMIQTMSEMLFANLDVSTNVLSWLIIFIAEDTIIQRDLRQEIRANSSLVDTVCKSKNSLLHLCFLESIRLRPFTAFTIPEYSPQSIVLGGYTIPPNTSVVVDTLAINYNPQFWGTNRTQFDPRRLEKVSSTDLRYNLFTFGFGSRKCLGKHFAEAMVKTFVAELLSRYEIRIAKTAADDSNKVRKVTWVPLSDIEIMMTAIIN
ncbi:Cytochrome P450 E-class group I [Penicillium solitum]|uniref:Cytochrome P450 E-class group I n=1 Tax=Penicillium solitum TaxID=60172 RepID=UPI0032C437D0|nr:Cytochrome P450 E-class group I [Penicillium solitum]